LAAPITGGRHRVFVDLRRYVVYVIWHNSGNCIHGVKLVLDKLRSRLVHFGPSLMSVPVKLAPFALKRQVLEQVLSWQFRQALAEGELEFLEGRWLSIHVRDIGLLWYTSVVDGRLVVSQQADADVSFSADASDLLMIAARKQDPDTLFFQRRLVIEGDTELGLYVKNLMDAIELEQMPKALRVMLLQLADFVEAGLKSPQKPEQTSVGEAC
jgi:predicted lipid carrier protein YhbT